MKTIIKTTIFVTVIILLVMNAKRFIGYFMQACDGVAKAVSSNV